MNYIPPVLQLILAAVTLAAGATDIRSRRIPNRLVLAGVLLGLGMNTLLYGMPGLILAAKGMGFALLIYFPLFALRAMGAGDAKLMAAVGAVVGPANWFGIFVAAAVMGAVAGLAVVVARRRLSSTIFNVGFIVRELLAFRAPYLTRAELSAGHAEAISLPHGAVIACASLLFIVAVNLWAPH